MNRRELDMCVLHPKHNHNKILSFPIFIPFLYLRIFICTAMLGSLVLGTAVSFVCVWIYRTRNSLEKREHFSCGPLGIRHMGTRAPVVSECDGASSASSSKLSSGSSANITTSAIASSTDVSIIHDSKNSPTQSSPKPVPASAWSLRRLRPKQKHSIISMDGITSLKDYVKKIDSRSVKVTMTSQIDRLFLQHHVVVRTTSHDAIGWQHFQVIYDHERKLYNMPRALLVTLMRFLVILLMVGSLDEYYMVESGNCEASHMEKGDEGTGEAAGGNTFHKRVANGNNEEDASDSLSAEPSTNPSKHEINIVSNACTPSPNSSASSDVYKPTLIAFSSTIVKGNTLRAMWFYQRPVHSHCMVWFHSVRTSLMRAMIMRLCYVDLGPSNDTQVAELKAKFGFAYVEDWDSICDYDGSFRHDIPPVDEVLSTLNKEREPSAGGKKKGKKDSKKAGDCEVTRSGPHQRRTQGLGTDMHES